MRKTLLNFLIFISKPLCRNFSHIPKAMVIPSQNKADLKAAITALEKKEQKKFPA